MSVHVERREFTKDVEPFGLLTEGAAGVAVIVLAIVTLAGISTSALASSAAIVIGGGLMVQAMNSAAERFRSVVGVTTAGPAATVAQRVELGGDVMVDCLCGLTGIILGILALVGIATAALLPAALIVYGGALLVGGAASAWSPGMFATGGMEMLIGLAAIVLGIVSVLMAGAAVLVLVGFLAVGAGLLLVSASFSSAILQIVRTA